MRDVVWLLFLGAALTGGLLYHAFVVVLAAIAGFLLAGSASIWRRYGLTGVRYASTLDRASAAFGETVELRTEIVNDKILPLAWITIGQQVPASLQVRGATVVPGADPAANTMLNALALMPYERVVRRFTVHCARRGRFAFHSAKLEAGDPFGLTRTEMHDGNSATLTVYPKLRKLVNLMPAAEGLIGDLRVRRWFPSDPIAAIGARPYADGDPSHAIDWRVTARTAALHVRELEATASPQFAIFLDAHHARADVLECAISFAASLVVESVDRGWAVGLYAAPANAGLPRLALPPARGAHQVIEALEWLAALEPGGDESFARMLEIEPKRLPFGVTPCAIVADPAEDDVLALASLSKRRRTLVFALDVDGSAARLAAQLPQARVMRVPFEADWTERDAVTIGV